MRVLVTGAAGFIGSQVCAALTARGHDVVAVDAMLSAAHGDATTPPEGVLEVDVERTCTHCLAHQGVTLPFELP